MVGPQPLAPAPMADQQPQWKCAECGLLNWPSRRKCRECRQRHTPGARGPATASPPRNHRRRDGGRDDDAAAGRRQQQGGRVRANSSPPKLRGGGAAPPESPCRRPRPARKLGPRKTARFRTGREGLGVDRTADVVDCLEHVSQELTRSLAVLVGPPREQWNLVEKGRVETPTDRVLSRPDMPGHGSDPPSAAVLGGLTSCGPWVISEVKS